MFTAAASTSQRYFLLGRNSAAMWLYYVGISKLLMVLREELSLSAKQLMYGGNYETFTVALL